MIEKFLKNKIHVLALKFARKFYTFICNSKEVHDNIAGSTLYYILEKKNLLLFFNS